MTENNSEARTWHAPNGSEKTSFPPAYVQNLVQEVSLLKEERAAKDVGVKMLREEISAKEFALKLMLSQCAELDNQIALKTQRISNNEAPVSQESGGCLEDGLAVIDSSTLKNVLANAHEQVAPQLMQKKEEERQPEMTSVVTEGDNKKQRLFVCPFPNCSKEFTVKGNMHRHMKNHLEHKRFECDICGQTFQRKADATIHMRLHTGERPFVCETCGLGFICSSDLRTHEKTHRTGSKSNFACTFPDCGKSFTRRHDLKKHSISVHGSDQWSTAPPTLVPDTAVSSKTCKHGKRPATSTLQHQERRRCPAHSSIRTGQEDAHAHIHTGHSDHNINICNNATSDVAVQREVSGEGRAAAGGMHVHGTNCGHQAILHNSHMAFLLPSGELDCFPGSSAWVSGKWSDGVPSSSVPICCPAPPETETTHGASKHWVEACSSVMDISVGSCGSILDGTTGSSTVSMATSPLSNPPVNCLRDAHGPTCGHHTVHHNDHIDYVVEGRLVHPLDEEWRTVEDHGEIRLLDDADFLSFLETTERDSTASTAIPTLSNDLGGIIPTLSNDLGGIDMLSMEECEECLGEDFPFICDLCDEDLTL